MKKTSPTTTHSVTVQGLSYHIRRRGSRYNILGPDGRAFATYQSAGEVGPRWEELTRTAWPHPSSAYQPGMRLQQIREAQRDLARPASAPVPSAPAEAPAPSAPAEAAPTPKTETPPPPAQPESPPAQSATPVPTASEAPPAPAKLETLPPTAKTEAPPAPRKPATKARSKAKAPRPAPDPLPEARPYQLSLTIPFTPAPVRVALQISTPPLALPAPRLNLAEHEKIMQQLRRQPPLLFTPRIRQALRLEVEYHRAQAVWAAHLLKLLARYDARQRKQQRSQVQASEVILEKHLAWQAQQQMPV